MIINGLSPGISLPEQNNSSLEHEKVEEALILQKEEIDHDSEKVEVQKEMQVKEASKEDEHKEKSRYALSDFNLKELLFLMSSRGNSATIEKLATLLKREKEILTKTK